MLLFFKHKANLLFEKDINSVIAVKCSVNVAFKIVWFLVHFHILISFSKIFKLNLFVSNNQNDLIANKYASSK